jgi:hypothetical protein
MVGEFNGEEFCRTVLKYIIKHGDNFDHAQAGALLTSLEAESSRRTIGAHVPAESGLQEDVPDVEQFAVERSPELSNQFLEDANQ